jgi:hypothetical protein
MQETLERIAMVPQSPAGCVQESRRAFFAHLRVGEWRKIRNLDAPGGTWPLPGARLIADLMAANCGYDVNFYI